MTQNKFAFFANFAETIRETIPAEKQAAAYQAICEYGIYGTLPDDPMLKMMCLMAKSSIYNKGGAPEGNQNAKKTTSETTKKQPKTTQNNPETTPFETETETETRNKKQETEAEAEAEAEIYSADAPNKSAYAFEGKIIKLKQKDFDAWKLAYPDLNLRAELMQRDDWLARQPEAEQKRWFMSTGQYFIKRNEYRKAQNAEIAEQFNNQPTANDDGSTWSFR